MENQTYVQLFLKLLEALDLALELKTAKPKFR